MTKRCFMVGPNWHVMTIKGWIIGTIRSGLSSLQKIDAVVSIL